MVVEMGMVVMVMVMAMVMVMVMAMVMVMMMMKWFLGQRCGANSFLDKLWRKFLKTSCSNREKATRA